MPCVKAELPGEGVLDIIRIKVREGLANNSSVTRSI